MKWLKKYEYSNASTLLETVIAITIISICVAIAITVYVNLMNSSVSIAKIKAYNQMEVLYRETVVEKNYGSLYFTAPLFSIEKEVFPVKDQTDLLRIEFLLEVGKKKFHVQRYIEKQ